MHECKFACILVLFNPGEQVIDNLVSLFACFDHDIYIINNGAAGSIPLLLIEKIQQFGLCVIENDNCGGLAGAYNRGVKFAMNHGCNFYFTFDQDSKVSSDFLQSMIACINKYSADFVCPNFFDVNSKTYATFVHQSKWSFKIIENDIWTTFAISSGLGFSKKAWLRVGDFNEQYFIDHVDTDYCMRAAALGYKVYINRDVCLYHAIGCRSVHKILGVRFKPNHHSKLRKYYIVRNGMHLGWVWFFRCPSFFYTNLLRVAHEMLCSLFFEQDKLNKFKMMFLGLIDGTVGRLGPFKNNVRK